MWNNKNHRPKIIAPKEQFVSTRRTTNEDSRDKILATSLMEQESNKYIGLERI
jgi:hypothetical protein